MKEKIEKTKSELDGIEDLKKSIFDRAKAWFESDPSKVDTHEFGEIIDVVKDLSEVNKYCWEALYFESVVKAMEEEYDETMRYGYNPNRYPSSGRYASKGHGSRMGYPMMEPEMWARRASERFGYPVFYDEGYRGLGDIRTGYGENGIPGYGRSGGDYRKSNNEYNYDRTGSHEYPTDQEYGKAYNMYRESRRHYTENKDPSYKAEMDHHAEEHLRSSIETIRDIWKDVDPAIKKKMKSDLQALVGELNV